MFEVFDQQDTPQAKKTQEKKETEKDINLLPKDLKKIEDKERHRGKFGHKKVNQPEMTSGEIISQKSPGFLFGLKEKFKNLLARQPKRREVEKREKQEELKKESQDKQEKKFTLVSGITQTTSHFLHNVNKKFCGHHVSPCIP